MTEKLQEHDDTARPATFVLRFHQPWNNSCDEGLPEQKDVLSIPFVAQAINAVNPMTEFVSCTEDVLLAVAKMFVTREYSSVPRRAQWNSLFWPTESESKNRETLLDTIFDAYLYEMEDAMERGDIAEGIATYKDIRDTVFWICTPDTAQGMIFARYLLKLVDARHGSRSMLERREVLGSGIVSLGKLNPKFQHPEIWKMRIALPQHLQQHFPQSGKLLYDTYFDNDTEDDDDDGNAIALD